MSEAEVMLTAIIQQCALYWKSEEHPDPAAPFNHGALYQAVEFLLRRAAEEDRRMNKAA
jgi:hypothetical protein